MNREPVTNASLLAGAVQAVVMLGLGMAVSLGWLKLDPEQMGAVERFVAAVVALVALVAPQIIAAAWARRQVTPLAAPRTASGEPAQLVPADLVTPQQIAVMAERAERTWVE